MQCPDPENALLFVPACLISVRLNIAQMVKTEPVSRLFLLRRSSALPKPCGALIRRWAGERFPVKWAMGTCSSAALIRRHRSTSDSRTTCCVGIDNACAGPVPDHGSLLITSPASSEWGASSGVTLLPHRPETRPSVWLRGCVCGRSGRFVDPFSAHSPTKMRHRMIYPGGPFLLLADRLTRNRLRDGHNIQPPN